MPGSYPLAGVLRVRRQDLFHCALVALLAVTIIFSANISPVRAASNDNNVEYAGVFADQGPLYMNPTEPTSSTAVTLKLRVFKGDITSANIKYYDTADNSFHWIGMGWLKNDVTGTFDFWQGTVPASASTKYYRFQINDGSATAWLNAAGITASEPSSGDFWIVPGFHTPTWSKNAIYYQIFPDRFYNGNTGNDITFQSSSPVLPSNGSCPSGSYLLDPGKPSGNQAYCAYDHTAWSQLPETTYNSATGKYEGNGEDFFGGDLAGITAKIDPYLKGTLGVNALYLNPIFTSPSNHKYDTQDYTTVDPHFGTNTDLQTLISTAHTSSGTRMSVILDGVFNHTSTWDQWFNKQNVYGTTGAYQSQSSQWYDRYKFASWPNGYCNWAGYTSLTKLNYSSTNLRSDLYRSSSSIMQTYLKSPYGIDGWRYDVADNLESITSFSDPNNCGGSDNHAIWQDIRPYLKGISSEALMLGEIWSNANAWTNGKELDSVMNYTGFNMPVSIWITCQNIHGENPGQCYSVSQFDAQMHLTRSYYPGPSLYAMMNSLSTHDTARFLWRAGGDAWKLQVGAIFQMTYVGAPSIYYGDEIGMNGGNDPDNRRTFDWNTSDWNMMILNDYQKLIQTRKQVTALNDGSYITLLTDDTNKLYSYGRWDANAWAIVILNNDSTGHNATVNAYQLSIPNGTVLTDALSGNSYTVTNGTITVPSSVLLGHDGVVLTKVPAGGTGG